MFDDGGVRSPGQVHRYAVDATLLAPLPAERCRQETFGPDNNFTSTLSTIGTVIEPLYQSLRIELGARQFTYPQDHTDIRARSHNNATNILDAYDPAPIDDESKQMFTDISSTSFSAAAAAAAQHIPQLWLPHEINSSTLTQDRRSLFSLHAISPRTILATTLTILLSTDIRLDAHSATRRSDPTATWRRT